MPSKCDKWTCLLSPITVTIKNRAVDGLLYLSDFLLTSIISWVIIACC